MRGYSLLWVINLWTCIHEYILNTYMLYKQHCILWEIVFYDYFWLPGHYPRWHLVLFSERKSFQVTWTPDHCARHNGPRVLLSDQQFEKSGWTGFRGERHQSESSASFLHWNVVMLELGLDFFLCTLITVIISYIFVGILCHQPTQKQTNKKGITPCFVCLFLSCPLTKTYCSLVISSPREGAFELQFGGPREGGPSTASTCVAFAILLVFYVFPGFVQKKITCRPHCCHAQPISSGGGPAYKLPWDSERRQGDRKSSGASTHHPIGQQVGACLCLCLCVYTFADAPTF